MMDARTWMVFILPALFVAKPLYAQESESETKTYQNKIVALPFAGYAPETRLMFGGLLAYQFKPGGAGPETRASQGLLSAIYTLNRQLAIEFIPTVILPRERWILDGYYSYSFFPEKYWGIGPEAPDEAELDVEYRRLDFKQKVLGKAAPGLYAGLNLRWSRLSDVLFTDQNDEAIPPEMIPGAEGSTLPAVGFSIRWDKRNSITFPTGKHYLELSTLFYPEWLGASFPHQSWELDARKYLDLGKEARSILAFHFRLRMTGGDLPFQEYSLLGGQGAMRGYYTGRFRDANAAQAQVELRQHLGGRFGLAVFLAGGEVWNRQEGLSFDNPKVAAGAGLRFNLNKGDKNNIRLDYGIGRHGSGLYITIGEAF